MIKVNSISRAKRLPSKFISVLKMFHPLANHYLFSFSILNSTIKGCCTSFDPVYKYIIRFVKLSWDLHLNNLIQFLDFRKWAVNRRQESKEEIEDV